MIRQISLSFGLALLAAACTQTDQKVPTMFAATADESEGTISANGGTLTSLAAGLSIRFPAGAFTAPTPVRIRLAPALTLEAGSGSPGGARPVSVTPTNVALRVPAELEFNAVAFGASAEDAWLTSVLLVNVDSARLLEDLSVDGTNNIARAQLPTLGALVPFIPQPSQYILATAAASSAALPDGGLIGQSESLDAAAAPVAQLGRRACGFWRIGSVDLGGGAPLKASYAWNGCDRITVRVDPAIRVQLGTVALQFFTMSGVLTAVGNAGTGQPVPLVGTLRVGGLFRNRLGGTATGVQDASGAQASAGSFALVVRIEATPQSRLVQLENTIVLQNVLYVSEETSATGTKTLESKVTDLVLPIATTGPGAGTTATLGVTRTVRLTGGVTGTASVGIELDLKSGCGSQCTFDR